MKKRLIIVDVSSFIFRAFYAVRMLNAPDGTPVNAVYGVITMLMKLMSKYRPTHILIARDTSGGSFRNEMYDLYKANRSEPPEELVPQFSLIEEVLGKFGLPCWAKKGYEADDLIASAVMAWKDQCDEIFIATGDKDLMQLVDGKVKILDTMKEKIYDPSAVFEKMGVRPDQIVDYLSILGDSSDNIPGMKGIGAKGAAKLLGEYGTLDGCIENKDKLTNKRVINAFENHIDDAILSRKLINLVMDLDPELSFDELDYNFSPRPELISFLEGLGLRSIVKKMRDTEYNEEQAKSNEQQVVAPVESKAFLDGEVKTLSFDHFSNVLNELKQASQLMLFCEGETFAFSVDGQTSYSVLPKAEGDLLTAFSDEQFCELYQAIVQCKGLQGYNLKPFFRKCLSCGIELPEQFEDYMGMEYLLNEGRPVSFVNLFFHYTQMMFEETKDLALRVGRYCLGLYKVADLILKEFMTNDSFQIYNTMEKPLIGILSKMEAEGILLNSEYLNNLGIELRQKIDELQKSIYSEAGEEFNIKSPKQVGEILFTKLELPVIKKTKTGFSTDSGVLSELSKISENPVPKLILEYRELEKILSTYVSVLPEMVSPETKKIHTHFNQFLTATGRLSCDKPNLQNIPVRTELGKRIRKAFYSNNYLLSADYSQIELRVLAHFSEDPTMVNAFQNDKDVHAETAAELFDLTSGAVTSDKRAVAKTVNFGLLYGQSAFGLSNTLGISRSEAKEYIELYFQKFSQVQGYLQTLKDYARETGGSQTIVGRRREIKGIHEKNRNVVAAAERLAINTPIQGSAAEIIKLAMIAIDEELKEKSLKSRMLLQVHDELIFDVPEDELEIMKQLVKDKMENVLKLKVPLKVDMGIGRNWYDLK